MDEEKNYESVPQCDEETSLEVLETAEVDIDQSLGKFKSAEELLKAYKSLESEFTKKSQKLSELERGVNAAEITPETALPKVNEDENWKDKVDKFFDGNIRARQFARDIAAELEKNPTMLDSVDCLEKAYLSVLEGKYREPSEIANDKAFIENFVLTNGDIKSAIVEGYLKELDDAKPPVTIRSLGQMPSIPPRRPKTIEEAGRMFRGEK